MEEEVNGKDVIVDINVGGTNSGGGSVAIIIITTTTIAVIAALVERTKLKADIEESRSIWRLIFPKVLSTKPPEVGCAIFSHEFKRRRNIFGFLPRRPRRWFQRSRWRRRIVVEQQVVTWTTQTIQRKSIV